MMIHQALALPRFTLPFFSKGFGSKEGVFVHQCQTKNPKVAFCSGDDQISSSTSMKTRKVVEHVCLLKAKENLSEEQEKDMLDYLYTSQYQMSGIVAISVGCIGDRNEEDYTHGLYMRFQRKQDLEKFYKNPFFLKVLNEHVTPFCHGMINVDYESEVEDDILPIFRKGESTQGTYEELEFLLFGTIKPTNRRFAFDVQCAFLCCISCILLSLLLDANLAVDAMEIFVKGREYKDMWRSQFEPFIEKAVALHFSVDPVGTDIM